MIHVSSLYEELAPYLEQQEEHPARAPWRGDPALLGFIWQTAWLNSLPRRAAACAGELIAVGVVDVLPRCLSSAYLFWDPALSWLALGKLTALKEIAWVQAAGARCPMLRSYHMVRSAAWRRGRPLLHPGTAVCLHMAALSMHAEGNAILKSCSVSLAR